MPRKTIRLMNQHGSVLLTVLSMTTIGSIALIATMFALKSLTKNLALSDLRQTANQILASETRRYTSAYLPGQASNSTVLSRVITRSGINYTYRQTPDVIRDFNWPMPGFSINSNYHTRLIHFSSQVRNSVIQTPQLFTGWKCTRIRQGLLSREPQRNYLLGGSTSDHRIGFIEYDFNSQTGQIHRSTQSKSSLLIGLDTDSGQIFSRADFASGHIRGNHKLIIVFAVTNAGQSVSNRSNMFYVLFDAIGLGEDHSESLSPNELVKIDGNYELTGHESGLTLELGTGHLLLSAISIMAGQVVFITQKIETHPDSGKHFFKNTLYQLNLKLNSGKIAKHRMLEYSTERIELETRLSKDNDLIISTQRDPRLIEIPVNCRGVYQYEI